MILLGDPHLGKEFKIGVPIERRGDREKMQREAFEASLLSSSGHDMHVNMGDLFDSFAVSRETIMYAAVKYKEAAGQNPDVVYVILMGNHDGRREVGSVSSFDLFCEMVDGVQNIFIARDRPIAIYNRVFLPWHPFRSAQEQLQIMLDVFEIHDWDRDEVTDVFGHWDLETFGGAAPHNLIPAKSIKQAFPDANIYTGHIHHPGVKVVDDVTVNVVGSMQPYAHGEGDLYVTLTLSELEAKRDQLRDKVVRLFLKNDEVLNEPVDCLQFSYKRLAAEEVDVQQVELGDFDFASIWNECMGDNPLADELWKRYEEKRNAQPA